MEKEENKTIVDNEDIKKNLDDDKTDKSENGDLNIDNEKKENSPDVVSPRWCVRRARAERSKWLCSHTCGGRRPKGSSSSSSSGGVLRQPRRSRSLMRYGRSLGEYDR